MEGWGVGLGGWKEGKLGGFKAVCDPSRIRPWALMVGVVLSVEVASSEATVALLGPGLTGAFNLCGTVGVASTL